MKKVQARIMHQMFERRLGVETAGLISSQDLGYQDRGYGIYQPSRWRTLKKALPKRSVTQSDVFLDLGSGMGRVVLLAAQYPFRRVIGVELSAELHQIAQRNLVAVRSRLRCRDVRLEHANVCDYRIPDDVTIVFLYNSFGGEVFDQAIRLVLASADRNPRRIRIVYSNPVEHDRLMATTRVRQTGESQDGAWRGRPHGILTRQYEVLPT